MIIKIKTFKKHELKWWISLMSLRDGFQIDKNVPNSAYLAKVWTFYNNTVRVLKSKEPKITDFFF